MKKVLITATVDSHIRHFHINDMKLLKENGYEVHVATNGDEKFDYCDVKHKVSFERNPFKINNLKAIKQMKQLLEKEKFDLIHTHTPMGAAVTRIAAKKTRKENNTRVIYTAHGFHFYKGAPIQNWLIFYPVEKYLSKYTDTLITINKEDYEFAKNKFKKTDIKYIHGVGIDPKKFDFEMTEAEKIELRKSIGLKKDDFVMIYTAELNKNKNQIIAIEAMKELTKKNSNIHLLLAGKGDLREYYESKVKEYNLQNNVHFLGYRNDVPKLLKISNIYISCSIREGLGLNLVEAMYVGKPVIASYNRGHVDLIKDGVNGFLFIVNDITKITNLVLDIYNKKIKTDKLIYNSKEQVKDFILLNCSKEMEMIYKFK